MPLIQSAADSLPYIDEQPSEEALASAHALIQAEIDPSSSTTIHSSIPSQRETTFSPLVQAEFERIQSGKAKEQGIDLSRYDVLDAPEKGNLEAWRVTLEKAYASSEYLRDRQLNLSLLETYGKNAWLIGNSQLEDVLRSLERELEFAKTELEQVEQSRRDQQANASAEMLSLQDTWKTGIGRMIEAQAAGEGLRQEILERRRQGVS